VSRLTEAQADMLRLLDFLGKTNATIRLDALQFALQRMAQLEFVAELARPVAAQDAGPFGWADACQLLDLALTELDHHPDTREPTTPEKDR
jgi:hypothetical protein